MPFHKVIGIDLGTTYSAVSIWDGKDTVVIESALTMDFPAGESAKATLPFHVEGPGVFLIRVEAGGDSDTTGMLRALVRNKASRAAIGVIFDPQAAKAAHEAGLCATVTLALGGKSGLFAEAFHSLPVADYLRLYRGVPMSMSR